MNSRTSFPFVFWVANSIEVIERFAYYGIYMGFGIYMEYLGYSKAQLGIVQSIFLLFSYVVPLFSGTLADKYGFKKMLIISYLAYLPSILLLIFTKSFSGIALTMLSIGLAAGIFKPLISGTVRAVTDKTNKTLGFGIFYAMVNFGASFGPLVAGKLRAISWNHAFIAAAICIFIMLIITIVFYKEPKRDVQEASLSDKLKEIGEALSDVKFSFFLLILGAFFWLPFWAFFNMLAMYVDGSLDTAALYESLKPILGVTFLGFLSRTDDQGVTRILGETISHTGYVIFVFQVLVSRISEKFSAIPTFLTGLLIISGGFLVLGFAKVGAVTLVFLGILLFAIGEMVSSPRIQEYITWIAPKEKAGLYMGTNFLAVGLGGALSGVTYTSLYGYFSNLGHVEYTWYTLGVHQLLGIGVIYWYVKVLGGFKELDK
ncbi:MAG: MFS transporter [Cyclobacteriaceae bacterium]|nr:MFS transporter [Cyclobacteriaceae bacterium]